MSRRSFDDAWADTAAWLADERSREGRQACANCRRWTPPELPGAPGRCRDGYGAWPSDRCDRFDGCDRV